VFFFFFFRDFLFDFAQKFSVEWAQCTKMSSTNDKEEEFDPLNFSLDELSSQRSRRRGTSTGTGKAASLRAKTPYSASSALAATGRRVYVGNLSYAVTWQTLKDHFRSCGDVVFAKVLIDRKGRSSGGGIVEFGNVDDARRAIKDMNDTDLNGRLIFVREDRDDKSVGNKSRTSTAIRESDRAVLAPRARRDLGTRGQPRGYKVSVSGLDKDASWQELKDHFKQSGFVARADVLGDGTGSVEFGCRADALAAVARFNETDFGNSFIQAILLD
jgi:RNA recognition motif-containing protein